MRKFKDFNEAIAWYRTHIRTDRTLSCIRGLAKGDKDAIARRLGKANTTPRLDIGELSPEMDALLERFFSRYERPRVRVHRLSQRAVEKAKSARDVLGAVLAGSWDYNKIKPDKVNRDQDRAADIMLRYYVAKKLITPRVMAWLQDLSREHGLGGGMDADERSRYNAQLAADEEADRLREDPIMSDPGPEDFDLETIKSKKLIQDINNVQVHYQASLGRTGPTAGPLWAHGLKTDTWNSKAGWLNRAPKGDFKKMILNHIRNLGERTPHVDKKQRLWIGETCIELPYNHKAPATVHIPINKFFKLWADYDERVKNAWDWAAQWPRNRKALTEYLKDHVTKHPRVRYVYAWQRVWTTEEEIIPIVKDGKIIKHTSNYDALVYGFRYGLYEREELLEDLRIKWRGTKRTNYRQAILQNAEWLGKEPQASFMDLSILCFKAQNHTLNLGNWLNTKRGTVLTLQFKVFGKQNLAWREVAGMPTHEDMKLEYIEAPDVPNDTELADLDQSEAN